MSYDRRGKFIYLLTPLLAFLPAVVASLPLFGRGFIPTHDGEYHIMRFWQFFTMLSVGHWFPRWAPDLNSGYGIPLFNFHYPFPNYLGSLLHVTGVSFVDAHKILLAFSYLGSTLFCFLWLSRLFGRLSAVAGTIVASMVPYWFVDLYVRGAVGEVMALAFLFMSLASIENRWQWLLWLSSFGIIVSHNIATLLFVPFLILYGLIRHHSSLWAIVGGILLASYFWIPAVLGRSFVVGLNTVDYRDHFPALFQLLIPSWGTGFSQPGIPAGEMSFQLGVVPFLVTLAAFAVYIRNKRRGAGLVPGAFFTLVGVSIFFMLELSGFLWRSIAFLPFIQYPWRFLSFLPPSSAFLAAYLGQHGSVKIAFALAVLAIVFAYPYTRPVVYAPRDDHYYMTRKEFTDGTSSLGNAFSTRWTSWKQSRPAEKIEVVAGDARVTTLKTSPLGYEFFLDSQEESRIRINTLFYPGWEVRLDATLVFIDYSHDGTITFVVSPGRSRVVADFRETDLRKSADTVSMISLFWFFSSVILGKRRMHHEHRN